MAALQEFLIGGIWDELPLQAFQPALLGREWDFKECELGFAPAFVADLEAV
jgi:hypothetical protein